MHKYNNEKLPASFEDFFMPFAHPNRNNNYRFDRIKNTFLSQFPTYFLPKIWNANDFHLKMTESHHSFKRLLYEQYISSYKKSVSCQDRSCVDCFGVWQISIPTSDCEVDKNDGPHTIYLLSPLIREPQWTARGSIYCTPFWLWGGQIKLVPTPSIFLSPLIREPLWTTRGSLYLN